MKLARFLFKPRWQSKDVATRRGAVAELGDAELVAALPAIARNDADASVRLAALRRLNQYEAWRERSTGDADGSLRALARSAYLAMLTGGSNDLPSLERRIAELDTLAGEEIERVASQANDTALRSAALERVTRPSLLAEVATGDADPKLRLVALSRVTDADALARIAERTRKTDKIVSRLARDRAEAARIAAGDTATIEARARSLCERIDALLSRPRSERGAELAALDEAWAVLGTRAPRQFAERFESTRRFLHSDTEEAAAERSRLRELRERLERALQADTDATALDTLAREAGAILAGCRHDLPERERAEAMLVELTQKLAQRAAHVQAQAAAESLQQEDAEQRREAQLEALAAQARFDAALERAQADKEKQREQHQALRRDLDALVIALEQQLEAGDLSHALATHARIVNLLEGLPPIARHDKRLVNAEARLAELRRWQRWSGNERRKQLCEAIEALPGQGLHPDAVATRVREARTEWQQLEALEGEADVRGSQGLTRRFQALCAQALKPAQGYFSKRDELRQAHRSTLETLLQSEEAEAAENADAAALQPRRQRLAEALRGLDAVEPRARKALAQRLKDLLARIDARLDQLASDVEAAKRRLIADAEKLAQSPDAAAAAREVRDLQARWKAAGNGRRRNDEAQWKLFRSHCDAIFARLDGARREREDAETAQRAAADALLAELTTLAEAAPDAPAAARRELEQRWAALETRERELQRRWQEQLQRLDAQQVQVQRRRRDAVFRQALACLALLDAVEAGRSPATALSEDWPETLPADGGLDQALQQRREQAIAGAGTSGSNDDESARRDLLVTLEFLGAIETPAEDKARRMDLQVARLSQRMSGSDRRELRAELLELLHRWVALGRAGSDAAGLQQRFDRAFDAALQQQA